MSAAVQGLNDLYLQQDVAQVTFQDPPRKGPPRQGANRPDIIQATTLFEQSQERIRRDIEALRISYVFADESVANFLSRHRAFPSVLSEAIAPLKKCFGTDKIFRLEVSADEDELRTLYVVVRWTASPQEAVAAIDRFDDEWWLEHMSPAVSTLSFTFE